MPPPPKAPSGLDAATIGAFQVALGLTATTAWNQDTDLAFRQFQQAKGWGQNYGLTGDQAQWANLTGALNDGNWDSAAYVDVYGNPLPPINREPGQSGGGVGGTTGGFGGGGWGGGGGGGGGGYTPNGGGQSGGGGGGDSAYQAELSASNTRRLNNAKADISTTLRMWGLESLTDWAWGEIQADNGEMLPVNIRQQDAYKTRFAGIEARIAAGKNPISENEYVQLENNYQAILHSYGIPKGLFDTRDYMAGMIAGDVSPSELNDRLKLYQEAAFSAPKETRDALTRFYGVSEGGLIAYFIDPEKTMPVLEQQFSTVGVAAAAERAGFATFDEAGASRLAQLGARSSDVSTFASLRKADELLHPLGFANDGGGGDLSKFDAAEASFGGNALAQDLLVNRSKERVAEFAGGGQVASTQRGAVGLGSGNN